MSRRRAFITVWLMMFLAVLACNAGQQGQPTLTPVNRTVTVRSVEGTATLQEGQTAQARPASIGDVLNPGARLETGADGRVVLELDDQTAIVIVANTTFNVNELSGSAATPVSRFFLNVGEVFAFKSDSLPEGGAFEIETPSGIAAIRGSSLGVNVNTQLTVTCLTGACSARTSAGIEAPLSGGQKVQVDQDGTLGNPEPLNDQDLAAAQTALAAAQVTGLVPDVNLSDDEQTDTVTPPADSGEGALTATATTTTTPTLTLTPTRELPSLTTTGPCTIATGDYTPVNIRIEPSLESEIVGSMAPFEVYEVEGRNADSSWYEIRFEGGAGWAAASVTRRGGVCDDIPDTHSTPTLTPTTTASPTTTVTPTATPRIAGDDEYRDVEVPYGGDPVTISGAISYPTGDGEDTIAYRWTDFPGVRDTPPGTQFRYSISCSGEGAAFVEIEFLDGSIRSCEETYNFVQEMYVDVPNSGGFTIYLTDGEDVYVEWEVTFSWYLPDA